MTDPLDPHVIWFAEQVSPSGRIIPVLFHGEKPSLATPDGPRHLFRGRVVPVAASDEDLPLAELQEIYGHPNCRRALRRVAA